MSGRSSSCCAPTPATSSSCARRIPLIGERHLRFARAYGERFPEEIAAFAEDSRRSLDELRRLYPLLQTAE